jgi:hypothetical protein
MGWTASAVQGYPGVMKSEELRRYEEEFQAMREMLGTCCLELGFPPTGTEGVEGEAADGLAQSPEGEPAPAGDRKPPAPALPESGN